MEHAKKIGFSIESILADQFEQDRKSCNQGDRQPNSVSSDEETSEDRQSMVDERSVAELAESCASWRRDYAFTGYFDGGWFQPPVKPSFFTLQGKIALSDTKQHA